jgi:hypothetical protein
LHVKQNGNEWQPDDSNKSNAGRIFVGGHNVRGDGAGHDNVVAG